MNKQDKRRYKNMKIEQKAKAYDKAIEKIKYVMEHGVSPTLNKEDLQDIFPELAESEDERIRKEIFYFVLENTLSTDMRQHRWIAWLEKQCSNISSFPENQRKYMEKYISLDKTTLIKLLAERDMNVEECISSFEKQDEYSSTVGKYFITPEESLRNEKKPIKKQDKLKWTEEDEDNLNMAIYFMRSENTPYSPTDVEPVVEWLCGLKQRIE